MNLRSCCTAVAALAGILLGGCEEPGETVLSVDGRGAVVGFAYLDRNGDSASNGGDPAFPDVRVMLLAGARPVAQAVTDSLGFFRVTDLPVGTYTIAVDESSLGDSVTVVAIDSARIDVLPDDSSSTRITLGYASATAESIATMEPGRRVAYTGIALNAWSAFGDSTVHLADSTGVIRVTGLAPATIAAGNRVRVIATVGARDGYVALHNATVTSNTGGAAPEPISLSTRESADPADSVRAALVRIRSAVMLAGTNLPGGDVLLTVDDSSGPLEVVLDVHAGIDPPLPIAVGSELDITGVLVPVEGTPLRWRLKPRRSADVIVTYPLASISAARAQPVGQYTLVHGIVLNDVGTFADNTLHIADTSAAIRVAASSGFISAGDSVSVLGSIGIRDSQPVLLNATISFLARTVVPPPIDLTPAEAATARNGTLDARLIRVSNVTVADTSSTTNGRWMRVSRGADTVQVFLDRNGLGGVTPPAIGATIDVTGLLAPITGGRWFIKPRNSSDIAIRPIASAASTRSDGHPVVRAG